MSWNINDRFIISGTVDLGTHCPRIRTTGTILAFVNPKKIRVLLDDVEGYDKVEAIVKLRDIKPVIEKEEK